jgi:hypothetical protein
MSTGQWLVVIAAVVIVILVLGGWISVGAR